MMVRRHGKGTDTTKPFWMKITVLILNVRGLNEAEKKHNKIIGTQMESRYSLSPRNKNRRVVTILD